MGKQTNWDGQVESVRVCVENNDWRRLSKRAAVDVLYGGCESGLVGFSRRSEREREDEREREREMESKRGKEKFGESISLKSFPLVLSF